MVNVLCVNPKNKILFICCLYRELSINVMHVLLEKPFSRASRLSYLHSNLHRNSGEISSQILRFLYSLGAVIMNRFQNYCFHSFRILNSTRRLCQ